MIETEKVPDFVRHELRSIAKINPHNRMLELILS